MSIVLLSLGRLGQTFLLFLVAGLVRNAPEWSWHASGPMFTPNRRAIFDDLGRTDILSRTWTRPGTGREALVQATLFFGRGGGKPFLFWAEGRLPERNLVQKHARTVPEPLG